VARNHCLSERYLYEVQAWNICNAKRDTAQVLKLKAQQACKHNTAQDKSLKMLPYELCMNCDVLVEEAASYAIAVLLQ
jgi:hypothetical protein